MNKKIFIYLTFIGLLGFLFSCQKEGTKAVLLDNPVAPTIVSVPDLALKRANGTNMLEFIGTPVDPGFQASVTYYLEACAKGNNFQDPVTIYTGGQDLSIKISVSDLNGIFLTKFNSDQVSSIDLRIRAALSLSSGTVSYEYNSVTSTKDATVYGLPRLDIVGSGLTQKIESPLGDGKYSGFLKLDITKPFTIKDPDANVVYGGTGGVLSVNGSALSATANGWYKLTVDTKALTYKLEAYMVGLIGSSTPNAWNSPDSKMDYDSKSGLWYITIDLTAGAVKIRSNDSWDTINLGLGDAANPQYTLTNLWNNSSSKDIPIATAGNYTIKVKIGSTNVCTITKNS